MAERKTKKGSKKNKVVSDKNKKIEIEVKPSETVLKKENAQIIWFFVIIAVIFASFLVPYFWIQSTKVFEYAGAEWVFESYENLDIYHGRFDALSGADTIYNLYLRIDPRENSVTTEGNFSKFKNGGVISFSPEVDACRGDLSRVMLDLTSFLKYGVGVGEIEIGSTNSVVAAEEGRLWALCNRVTDRTLVIVDIGNSSVVQDKKNPYCYTIYAESCEDISSTERFIVKTMEDFGGAE